eukprot:910503-Prymnesium_polylepis.2
MAPVEARRPPLVRGTRAGASPGPSLRGGGHVGATFAPHSPGSLAARTPPRAAYGRMVVLGGRGRGMTSMMKTAARV